MEESYLRSTLLNIQDRLSNNDRQRLHFLLCDHLPRRIVDDTSHQGTLLCVESLLDQNKINERNLTFLTNALEAIGRLDLVRLLKAYPKQNPSIKRLSLSMSSLFIEHTGDRDESDLPKYAPGLDFNQSTNKFDHVQLDEKSFEDNDRILRISNSCLSKSQFLLIDIVNRFDEVSIAMLKALQSMVKKSLLICPDTSTIDLHTRSRKKTFLFISSEFAQMIVKRRQPIEAMFILENDPSRVDNEKRFGTGLDLVFQLADEIYRCCMKEARAYARSGDLSTANIKEEHASRIHAELKRIYNSVSKDGSSMEKPIDITTPTIAWLDMSTQQTTTAMRLNRLLSNIVSSFLIFADRITCEQYLAQNKSMGMVFLVINSEHQISFGMDFHELSNIKLIYYYEKVSLKNESLLTDYNDLCFRLLSDLATHYNNLGSLCSAKNDAKTAKEMFLKTHELYRILANLREYQ